MLSRILRATYRTAKSIPLLRSLLRQPWITRWKAELACRLAVRDQHYEQWLTRRLAARAQIYRQPDPPGLLSLITTVWNTPLPYLRILTDSVRNQVPGASFEWVLLDNGSTDPQTRAHLQEIPAADGRIRLLRVEQNLGISGGMRLCLEQATGRYIVPVDSDDRLDPDTTAILAHWLTTQQYPPLAYTDEDHLLGQRRQIPYFKPEWDPVLLQNSAYIAHLCAIDRQLALQYGCYTSADANGCHDWDTYLRFTTAGHQPLHIPEVVYSWRMHGQSTAANVDSKNYIHQSHRAVLSRAISRLPNADQFVLEYSSLFQGTPDWHFRRLPGNEPELTLIRWSAQAPTGDSPIPEDAPAAITTVGELRDLCARLNERRLSVARPTRLVALLHENVLPVAEDWRLEAIGLLERFPDTALIGGRIEDPSGRILDAGRVLVEIEAQSEMDRYAADSNRRAICLDRGRLVTDSGYFAQMWKQRTVSALGVGFCVMRLDLLEQALSRCSDDTAAISRLVVPLAELARQSGQRMIYSPFLHGRCQTSDSERIAEITGENQLLPGERATAPDDPGYAAALSLGHPYQPDLAQAEYCPRPPAACAETVRRRERAAA